MRLASNHAVAIGIGIAAGAALLLGLGAGLGILDEATTPITVMLVVGAATSMGPLLANKR